MASLRRDNLTIDSCTFSNNSATIDGCILYARTLCTVTIGSSSFIGNSAINDGITFSLVFGSSIIMLDNCIFSDNVAGHDGGSVYICVR